MYCQHLPHMSYIGAFLRVQFHWRLVCKPGSLFQPKKRISRKPGCFLFIQSKLIRINTSWCFSAGSRTEVTIPLLNTPTFYHRVVYVDFRSWHQRWTLILGLFLNLYSLFYIHFRCPTARTNKVLSSGHTYTSFFLFSLDRSACAPVGYRFEGQFNPNCIIYSTENLAPSQSSLLCILQTRSNLLYVPYTCVKSSMHGPLSVKEHHIHLYLLCHNTCLLLLRTIYDCISLSNFSFSISWWSRTQILR